MLKIGFIRNTHGIKGELKVVADNPVFRKGFNKPLFIDTKPLTEVHIKNVKETNDCLLVSFKEFDDINQVEKFKGLDILINKEDLDPLDEDEYYIDDLVGLDVYNQDNEFKGKVIEVFELPQSFYLRVGSEEKNHLIPFIDEFILEVLDDKIIINEIEGLFNEN